MTARRLRGVGGFAEGGGFAGGIAVRYGAPEAATDRIAAPAHRSGASRTAWNSGKGSSGKGIGEREFESGMADGNIYLRIRNITKDFGGFRALDDISLDVRESEFICFLGPSGCGKTTLLRIIAGLEQQTSGTLEQAGKDISGLPPTMRDFGIVFQSYALFPNLTVNRNVSYGLENQGMDRAAARARVGELLDLVGLSDQGTKYPAQLSGGQQQRVALARALATSPGLLLLDEPLSALDAKVRGHLRHEIKHLQRRLGVTTIMVTHDQEEALTMADRIVVMDQGVIDQVGRPTEIYREPKTLFVADFIGAMNKVAGRVLSAESIGIGDITLRCAPHRLETAGPATIAIRPEDIIPHTDNGAGNGMTPSDNAFEARIEEMEFLGSFWRASLGGESLDDARLIADFSVNAVRRLDLAIGKTITVEVPPDRVKAFPRAMETVS